MAGINCDDKNLGAEDFLKSVVRTDGAGNYAIAVNDVTGLGFTNPATCGDGVSWEDIVRMVFDKTKNAFNIVDET